MPSMDVSVEIALGKEASSEVVLTVDFSFQAGTPAHYGSLSYPGHPAEPAEVEIETIFWPIKRHDEKKGWVDDHIEMPSSGLPPAVSDAVEAYIIENYVDDWEPCDD